MPRTLCTVLALAGAIVGCSDKKTPTATGPDAIKRIFAEAGRPQLTKFGSEHELADFFGDLAAAYRAQMQRRDDDMQENASKASAEPQASAGSASGSESITNTQVAGVDEGGIVKVHGDHLVVLRRGRLFTVKIGADLLTPVAHADAFGPGIDPSGAWYDEMLISGDTAIVIGYSYQRGGTEIGLFDLGGDGSIKYRATYHMKANDYYSSRNYASRIVGGKLVFYSPMYLAMWGGDPMASMPAIRRWHPGATAQEFKRILAPTEIYRPVAGFSAEAMHTVTVCDLSTKDMECNATAVMGPAGRTFYVSESAVYVWATTWEGSQRSMVVRMPLDGSAPAAIKTRGAPVDQFSFLERDGFLNVLVRGEGAGDAMWAPEITAGDVGMIRVPVASFSANVPEVPSKAYAQLPRPAGNDVQNRFVGDTLIYGAGSSWGYAQNDKALDKAVLYPIKGGSAAVVPLEHPVDRIEALGNDAIIVGGTGADLHFSAVSLDRHAVAGSYVRKGAAQGETRSHGFFYKPDADGKGGVLGLPVRSASAPGAAQLVEGSASITFLRNQSLQLTPLGELEAGRDVGIADQCKASCVDWYGNARPIFIRGRIIALLGYELVEGAVASGGGAGGDKVVERRRVNFAPEGQ